MDLSLKSKPSCHTLSNAFDISKKTDLTSRVGLQSNASNLSRDHLINVLCDFVGGFPSS